MGVIVRMTQTERMRLWLLRHAKSSWDEPELDDRDRPLAPRGEQSADRMRDYVLAEGIRPAVVLCSSALRTRQTLARVLSALGPELEVHIEPGLYTFDAASLLERVRAIPDGVSAMLIGHNPGHRRARREARCSWGQAGCARTEVSDGCLGRDRVPGGLVARGRHDDR